MIKLARRTAPAIASFLFLGLAGCGQGGGGSSGASGSASTATPAALTTAAGTTAGLTAVGLTPAGVTAPGTTATPGTLPGTAGTAAWGPTIRISSPQRASFTTQLAAKVEGTVTDPKGIAIFVVQGQPVTISSSGAFATVVPLTPGVNTIVVEAANPAARWSKQSLSVIAGAFQPDAQPISDALVARLNQGTFDAVARVAAAQLGGAALAQQIMARNPLFRQQLTALGIVIASAEVNATKASFGTPALKLQPVPGALDVTAEIPQVYVEVNARSVGGIPYSLTGHVQADRATIQATAVVTITNGVVATQLTQTDVQLQNFSWGINGFPSLLTNLAQASVKKLIENEIEKQLQAIVPKEIDKAIAAATKPITQTVMGTTATFSFAPTQATFDSLGHTLRLDANVAFAPIGSASNAAPGSLVSLGGVPANGGPTPAFVVSLNEDFANRATHAAWKAGLIEIALSAATAQKLGVPAWLPLDTDLVRLFFPELRNKLPAAEPIELRVSAKLPPVLQARPKPSTIETAVGDLALEIWHAPKTGTPRLVLSFALHARLAAGATLSGSTLKVAVPVRPSVDGSLVDSPLAPDLNPTGCVAFLQFVAPPVVQLAAGAWQGLPLPVPAGLTPKNVDVDADGARKTFVSVKGDF